MRQIPHSLSKKEGYKHREALFGVPLYGGSLHQNVYYADSDLCEPNVNTRGGYPIRALDKDGKMAPWPSPYILMVDRGNCTFVSKVRNAQRSGAAGVIIADNTCLCKHSKECVPDAGQECESKEPLMSDDGSGADISIPSVLMYKEDVDPIKAELKSNHNVRVEMAWSLPAPDARVEYDLWTTPTDLISQSFQQQFKEAAVSLGKHAYFTPHMYIYDGTKSGCRDDDGKNICESLCTNNGRYCATDPDNNLDKGISGADVVRESLRRTCIWKIYGEEDGIGEPWWTYVEEFIYRCNNEKYFASEDCVKDAMTHASVDYDKVNTCIDVDTGGLDKDTQNSMLDDQLSAKDAAGITIMPAALINKAIIRGELEFATVFKAVCAGYATGSEPSICYTCANCQDEFGCVAAKKCASDASNSVSTPIFGSTLGSIVFCFGCIGLIQWQRSQRHMRAEVKGILAEYMPVDENNKVASATDVEDGEFT